MALPRRQAARLARKLLWLALGSALFLGGAYLLTLLGPRPPAPPGSLPAEAAPDPAHQRWRQWVAQFLEAETAGRVGTEEVALLERALDARADLRAPLNREERESLQDLERKRDFYRGEPLFAESLAAERLAEQAGDEAARRAALERAVDLQRTLNRDFPQSPRRDLNRLLALENRLCDLAAAPLAREADALEAEANALVAAGRNEEAAAQLAEAVARLRRLAGEYPLSRYADRNRLLAVEQRLRQLREEAPGQRVLHLVTRADEELGRGRPEEAAARYAEAIDLLRLLPAGERTLRLPSEDALAKRQRSAEGTARARELALAAHSVDLLLRAGNAAEAAAAAGRLARDLDAWSARFPDHPAAGEEWARRLRFLTERADRLAGLHATLKAHFLALPDGSGWALGRTEVPQRLHEALTGSNPSRDRQPELPVESVTWEEAAEAARRAGWVLGRDVRLPPLEVFARAAAGRRAGWFSDRASALQPVATFPGEAGDFADLAGNAAEWLAAEAAGNLAPFIESSVRQEPPVGAAITLGEAAKTDRSRFRGYRLALAPE